MEYQEAKKRLLAARALLLEPTTTYEKVSSLHAMLKGVHPALDKALAQCQDALSTLEKISSGAIIELTAENLPEETEDQKKRKKALLLFINTWKQLQSEVMRIQQELQQAQNSGSPSGSRSVWAKIFGVVKGPLGIITIVAAAIVLAMNYTSVQIAIHNEGCGTMQVAASIPLSLPGLSIPTDSIPDKGSATATIPPLTLNVDGTKPGLVALQALTLNVTFQLPSDIKDVTMNGVSLLGKKQAVHLSERKEHNLTLVCE